MKSTRRSHEAAFKAQAALGAFKGDATLAELAAQFGVPPAPITGWKPHWRTRASSINRLPDHTTPNNSHVPTECVVSGTAYHPFCADVQTAAARLPNPGRIRFLN